MAGQRGKAEKRSKQDRLPAWARALEGALPGRPVLHRFETIAMGEIWGERFHTTPYHELIHVQQGSAELKFRRRSFRVGPGDTFVIPEGTEHKDVPGPAAPYRVFLIFFQWPGADELVGRLDPRRVLDAPPGARTHLHWLFRELDREYLSDEADSPARVNLILLEALLALVRLALPAARAQKKAVSEAAARRRSRLAARTREHLIQHFAEPAGLEELAAELDVSPYHLSRTFSREFGHSITDAVGRIRMERAKQLLKSGTLSVKQVAAAVGYSSGNYFAKVFRRICGVSPSEYQVMTAEGGADLP